MFKLNKKSKKIMRALSLGIVSLGLLAGIGMTNGSTNVHAMTAEQIFNDPDVKAVEAEDEAEANAIGAKEAREASPSEDKVEQENIIDNEPTNLNQKHVAHHVKSHSQYKKPNKHAQRHNKNLARNKRAKRASRRARRTRRAKKHSHKKARLVKKFRNKKSARVVRKSTHHNWSHVRPSQNHLSKLTKNHKKDVKTAHKSDKLTKKQVTHFNSLVKHDKRVLKSNRAKHNYKYRKFLLKSIKSTNKFLKLNNQF